MTSLPDVSSRPAAFQGGFQDAAFSGRTARQEVSSYERMDAGLTIKTREGDIVTLSTSRFSELNARDYTSQGRLVSQEGEASVRTHQRQIQLATGERFSFSVQGDLNEQELADIESIVSGIDGIIYEMAQGDMDEAVARALSMGSYDSVAGYQADISVARSYSAYTETRTAETGPSLPGTGLAGGWGGLRPAGFASPFMKEMSSLLEAQEADALAHARKPLSQLFDHYLDQQAQLEGESQKAAGKAKSPMTLALETTARTVDQLIQEMMKEAFDQALDQMV